MNAPPRQLTVEHHDRDAAGMTYVYPVVSRRAGGVSVGINLNPNNACNWRCVYCQVPDLVRGGPPPIALDQLKVELENLLDQIQNGDFLQQRVPADARHLVDVAFSGNGEPTSAAEFAEAVKIVAGVLARRHLTGKIPLRLITNGSLIRRTTVQDGVRNLAAAGGEVWFKVDAVTSATTRRINNTRTSPESLRTRLELCISLCPTWVQTCVFSMDGHAPPAEEVDAYIALLGGMSGKLGGVFLYGLARPSLQPEAARLSNLSAAWMETLATRLRQQGLTVRVNP
ncbi:MAG: radical SAM protein [Proteobacteria bacterium]|nr:radical SAM protein [Pseudomonadota bacterium]HQR02748.1 radical SAM protein [Rhodocyclaceae bacterium]